MIRIDAVYTGLQGLPGRSSFYFAGDSQAIAEAGADAVQAFFVGIQENISNQVVLTVSDIAVVLNEQTGVIVDYLAIEGGFLVGSNVADPLPIGTSMVTGFVTNTVVRGRRVLGRTYLPGLTEGAVGQTGTLTPAAIAAFEQLARNSFQDAGALHVVWSRPLEAPDGTVTVQGTAALVTDYRVPAVLSNLRTRRR